MGVRKRETADARKEANKSIAFAKLNNCPTSPRKMRLVADLVRGQKVERALNILRFSSKEASRKLEKLVLSAINNWEQKNADGNVSEAGLFIKTTENKNYQDAKKWGKYLIIIGIASLIIRNIDLLIN